MNDTVKRRTILRLGWDWPVSKQLKCRVELSAAAASQIHLGHAAVRRISRI